MKELFTVLFTVFAVVALVNCGKKKDDAAAAAPVTIGALSVTCGGLACVGTEGK